MLRVSRTQSEQESRLGILYRTHREALLRFLGRKVGVHDASDLAHETFLRVAHVALDDPPLQNERAFLFKVRGELGDRSSASRGTSGTPAQRGGHCPAIFRCRDDAPGPDRDAKARADLRRLTQALSELPPRRATAFRLSRIEGMSHAAIATHLGVFAPHGRIGGSDGTGPLRRAPTDRSPWTLIAGAARAEASSIVTARNRGAVLQSHTNNRRRLRACGGIGCLSRRSGRVALARRSLGMLLRRVHEEKAPKAMMAGDHDRELGSGDAAAVEREARAWNRAVDVRDGNACRCGGPYRLAHAARARCRFHRGLKAVAPSRYRAPEAGRPCPCPRGTT